MFGAPLEDGIAEVVQAASGAQGLVFAEVLDGEVVKLGRRILNEVAENGFLVVANQVDFVDRGDLLDGLQAVPDDGVAGDFEKGLGEIKRERAESRATRGATDL